MQAISVQSYFDFYGQDRTRFTDAIGRVWEKRIEHGNSFLIGITKDTPSFTAEQLKGIVIEGFAVLHSDHEKDDSHKRSVSSRFLRR